MFVKITKQTKHYL